jgi:FixJ family two-component response regulator
MRHFGSRAVAVARRPRPHHGAEKGAALNPKPLIAVIDDDTSLCAALVGLVRSFGYDARGFSSAEEFLRADDIRGSSCIISDIHMPGMNGIELKRHLTARNWLVPTIMITGRLERGLEESVFSSGAIGLLTKPFDAGALIACIERALGPAAADGDGAKQAVT